LSNSKKLTGLKKRRFLQEGALDRNIFVRLTLREFERERAPPMPQNCIIFFGIRQSWIKYYIIIREAGELVSNIYKYCLSLYKENNLTY